MKQLPLIVVAGPTAAGKSALAVALAERINGAVISADSMQVYRGQDIGTAKIRPEEMHGIEHAMIDIVDPHDEFTVADYKKQAQEAIGRTLAQGRLPILTGGTGFYIQAVIRDIDFDRDHGIDEAFRREMMALSEQEGAQALHEKLARIDPESARRIHPNNTQRVIRALEYYEHTGEAFSDHNRREAARQSRYHTVYFVLSDSRSVLYERINRRAEAMIEEGLIEEVMRLREAGLSAEHQSMRSLGYRETLAVLDGLPAGTYPDEETRRRLAQEIAQNTRHYAKRQITWFKREQEAIWLMRSDHQTDDLLDIMIRHLTEAGIVHDAEKSAQA